MTFSAGGSVRVDIVQVRPQRVASIREIIHRDRMTESLGRMFQVVGGVVNGQTIAPAGPLFARWHSWGELADLEAGMPVASEIAPEGIVVPSELPGGAMAHTVHMGMYDGLEAVYQAVSSWLERIGADARRRSVGVVHDRSAQRDRSRPLAHRHLLAAALTAIRPRSTSRAVTRAGNRRCGHDVKAGAGPSSPRHRHRSMPASHPAPKESPR